MMILEYLAGGDLLGFLRKSRGHKDSYNTGEFVPKSRLSEKELLSFAWMVAEGMTFLSSRKVNRFVSLCRLSFIYLWIGWTSCMPSSPVCPTVLKLHCPFVHLFAWLPQFVLMSFLPACLFVHSPAGLTCPQFVQAVGSPSRTLSRSHYWLNSGTNINFCSLKFFFSFQLLVPFRLFIAIWLLEIFSLMKTTSVNYQTSV